MFSRAGNALSPTLYANYREEIRRDHFSDPRLVFSCGRRFLSLWDGNCRPATVTPATPEEATTVSVINFSRPCLKCLRASNKTSFRGTANR